MKWESVRTSSQVLTSKRNVVVIQDVEDIIGDLKNALDGIDNP